MLDENIPRSLYERLGVSSSADSETLRRSFRKLSKYLHPDTASIPIEQAEQQFHELCKAYELLIDPIRRKAYDDSLTNASLIREHQQHKLTAPSHLKANPDNSVGIGRRRDLSGGELFSLLLLVLSLIFCMILGLTVAKVQGRDLQVTPSWMSSEPMTQVNPGKSATDALPLRKATSPN